MDNEVKEVSVFEGNRLRSDLPETSHQASRCHLIGCDITGNAARISLDDELLSKHMVFLGGIGTGKTNAIFQVVEQLQSNMTGKDVMLIFDTKGDFYDTFYRKGDIVISNDEKATGADAQNYWNIYRELELGRDVEEEVVEMSDSLFLERKEKSGQPFFPNAASDLFAAILLHFMRKSNGKTLDNAGLRSFFDRSTPAELRELLGVHPDLKAVVNYIDNDHSAQTQGVISELQQLIREIFIGNFRKPGTISIRDCIRAKGAKTIFVEYDLSLGNMLGPIYRLLLDLAIKEALSRKKSDGNVWFIIDEFRLVPNLQHVDDGVNFGRSLGAKFLISVQNVEQIFHLYGESLARSILSGFQSRVAFRVNDIRTRDYIKDAFGKNRKREAYMAFVQSRGIVEDVREANVVEDWDILNLKLGRSIVGLPGEEPFLFQFDEFKR